MTRWQSEEKYDSMKKDWEELSLDERRRLQGALISARQAGSPEWRPSEDIVKSRFCDLPHEFLHHLKLAHSSRGFSLAVYFKNIRPSRLKRIFSPSSS